MPAVSKAQQRFMGMVYAAKKGKIKSPSPEVAQAASSMKKKDAKDFASTKHKGLPEKKFAKEANDFSDGDVNESRYDRYDSEKKRFDKDDKRMKHGKRWREFTKDAESAKNRLRPGEVKKFNKETGKYESNKD